MDLYTIYLPETLKHKLVHKRKINIKMWHFRIGHPAYENIKKLAKIVENFEVAEES